MSSFLFRNSSLRVITTVCRLLFFSNFLWFVFFAIAYGTNRQDLLTWLPVLVCITTGIPVLTMFVFQIDPIGVNAIFPGAFMSVQKSVSPNDILLLERFVSGRRGGQWLMYANFLTIFATSDSFNIKLLSGLPGVVLETIPWSAVDKVQASASQKQFLICSGGAYKPMTLIARKFDDWIALFKKMGVPIEYVDT